MVFEANDYRVCGSANWEPGIEKVAIYVDEDGVPTHVAKQLENGDWTSKLGDWEDIEHKELDALASNNFGRSLYGSVALILQRTAISPSDLLAQ